MGAIHDVIPFYTKGNTYTWNKVYTPYADGDVKKYYKHTDNNGNYKIENLTAPGVNKGGAGGQPWREIDVIARGRD